MKEKHKTFLVKTLHEGHEASDGNVIVPTDPDEEYDGVEDAGLYVDPEKDLQQQDDEKTIAMPEGVRIDAAKRLAYKAMHKIKKAVDAGKASRQAAKKSHGLYDKYGHMVP